MPFYIERPEGYEKPVIHCGPSMTKKSQQKECDINNIIKKFDRTGVLAHMAPHEPTYMDVDPITYQDALQIVIDAQAAFNDLPSKVRSKFNNDPQKFLEFTKTAKKDELVELGLADAPRKNEIPSEEPKDAPD